MKTRNVFQIVTLAAGTGFIVFAWKQASRARAARLEIMEVSAQNGAAQLELGRTEERVAAAEGLAATRRKELETLRNRTAAIPPPKPPVAAPVRRSFSTLELIRSEPDAEALFLEMKRSELDATYGPLFRSLGLSEEAAAQFRDNTIKREEARMDLEDVRRTMGEGESGTGVAQLRNAAENHYDTAQRELLGEAGYRQLQNYEGVAWIWSVVGATAGVAAIEHAPMNAAQAEALVQAISEANRNRGASKFTEIDIDWNAVDARARTLLSAEQFAVFSTMDPGPTRGGLLQTRMYARVNEATRLETKDGTPRPSR